MQRKLLQQLVMASYTDGGLDTKKVSLIADHLKRHELKEYIAALKRWEKRSSIIIEVPFAEEKKYADEFHKLFPTKKVIINVNPKLLLGIRITDNDEVHDLNLHSNLHNLLTHIEQTYD